MAGCSNSTNATLTGHEDELLPISIILLITKRLTYEDPSCFCHFTRYLRVKAGIAGPLMRLRLKPLWIHLPISMYGGSGLSLSFYLLVVIESYLFPQYKLAISLCEQYHASFSAGTLFTLHKCQHVDDIRSGAAGLTRGYRLVGILYSIQGIPESSLYHKGIG